MLSRCLRCCRYVRTSPQTEISCPFCGDSVVHAPLERPLFRLHALVATAAIGAGACMEEPSYNAFYGASPYDASVGQDAAALTIPDGGVAGSDGGPGDAANDGESGDAATATDAEAGDAAPDAR